jgi:hypothetical protein
MTHSRRGTNLNWQACWPGQSLTNTSDTDCVCFAELGFCDPGKEPVFTPGVKCGFPTWFTHTHPVRSSRLCTVQCNVVTHAPPGRAILARDNVQANSFHVRTPTRTHCFPIKCLPALCRPVMLARVEQGLHVSDCLTGLRMPGAYMALPFVCDKSLLGSSKCLWERLNVFSH